MKLNENTTAKRSEIGCTLKTLTSNSMGHIYKAMPQCNSTALNCVTHIHMTLCSSRHKRYSPGEIFGVTSRKNASLCVF